MDDPRLKTEAVENRQQYVSGYTAGWLDAMAKSKPQLDALTTNLKVVKGWLFVASILILAVGIVAASLILQ